MNKDCPFCNPSLGSYGLGRDAFEQIRDYHYRNHPEGNDMELDQPTPTACGDDKPPKHNCTAEIIAELERLRKDIHDNQEFRPQVIIAAHIEELKAKETQL